MQKKNDIGPRNTHTIVLQPRRASMSRRHNSGLEQRYFDGVQHTSASPQGRVRQSSAMVPMPPPQSTREHTRNIRIPEGDLLTRFGVDSVPGRMVARILIALVLFQPVYIAFGMELEEQAEEVAIDAQSQANTQNDADVSEPEMTVEEPQDESEEARTEIEEDLASDGDTDGESAVEATTVGDSSDDEYTEEDEGSVKEEQSDSAEEIHNGDEVSENDGVQEEEPEVSDPDDTQEEHVGGTSTDDASEDENTSEEEQEEDTSGADDASDGEGDAETDESLEDEDTASTTEEADIAEPLETTINNATNKYIFGEGDCTLVTEGEFYCIKEGPTRERMSGDVQVYAEKDREGDKEIYYFDGTEVVRITNNSYDDFAPVYDDETRRIVWHAMINDRLQIMLHEIPTNTTRQITTSRENSSTPSIAGDTVVWQEWVETNWEIMMTDVDNDGQPFEIERLTDNAVHDMFPVAYDDLITWQSERGGVWEVVVYDIRTGKKRSVEKTEDTKYENPRFVLLFDSKHENGDVETIGYDLDSGEMMELGTTSMPAPREPITPKEETPEAVLREASGTTQVKVETDGDDGGGDDGGNEESES